MFDTTEYPLFICAIVSFLMTFGWSIFDIGRKRMLVISIAFIVLCVIAFKFYYRILIIEFITSHAKGIPVQFFSPLSLFTVLIFAAGKIKGKEVVTAIIYTLNIIILLFGLEALKAQSGSSGGYFIFFGGFLVFNALLTLQVLTYTVGLNLFFGINKFLIGIVSSAIILLFGFSSVSEFGRLEIWNSVRYGSVLISAIMIIEGSLLIYKARKEKYFRIRQMKAAK